MRAPPRFPAPDEPGRRRVLRWMGAGSLLAGGGFGTALAQTTAPAVVVADSSRPQLPYGVMSGDVSERRAMVWSRSDRPARMLVEVATTEAMRDARRLTGPAALEASDFTARVDLVDLPPGQTCFYRVQFESLADPGVLSVPVTGRLRTPSDRPRDVVFAFSGDEAGQGWGINEAFGGYRVYEAMRRFEPDFFIHSGDQIYADGPIAAEVTLDNGTLVEEHHHACQAKVAQTLDDFRGNFAYNLLDANKRRFCAEVPMLVQWDDHETRNNWYPGQQIGPEEKRYQQRSTSLLSARANRAMFDYNPMRPDPLDPERVYRAFRMGSLVDVLMLDERSYRGANSPNRQIGWPRGRLSRTRAGALAEASIENIARHVEGDRQRHAAVDRRAGPQSRRSQRHLRSVGQRRRRPTFWTRAGGGRSAALHQT